MKSTRARRLDAFGYEIYHYGRPVGLVEQIKPRKWVATPTAKGVAPSVAPETFSAKRSAEAWLARVHEGKRLPAEAACGWEN